MIDVQAHVRPVKRIVVIGCSGHAKVILDIIEQEKRYEIGGLLDTYKVSGTELRGYQVLGTEEDLPALFSAGVIDGGIVAIGDNWMRRMLVARIMELVPDFAFISTVHPSAQVAGDVIIGRGSVVMPGVVINSGSRVGDFCIVNTKASLDHDCVMGEFSSLGPGAVTGGGVRIGAFSVIAIGATVVQDIRIGEHTVVGAGATVIKDLPDRVVAYGTPARVIRERKPGDAYLNSPRARSEQCESSPKPALRSKSLHLISVSDPNWSAWLERLPHDVFHTAEYHQLAQDSGQGEAWLAVYGTPEKFLAWPYLLKEIAGSRNSSDPDLRDMTSVYGYSGPVASGFTPPDDFVRSAWAALTDLWRAQGVVSVFTRFHPLLQTHRCLNEIGISCRGQTIAIDLLTGAEETWNRYKPKLRQSIRRCRRHGFVTTTDPDWEHLEEFIRLYYRTMQRNRAAPFYLFPGAYFRGLKKALGSHATLMFTRHQDVIAAAALVFEYGGIVSVHLAATNEAFSQLSPCKLLLHDAQAWARERGNRLCHVGGGRGSSNEDSLFRFKAMFSPSRFDFYTGNWVLDQERYDYLAEERRKQAVLYGGRELVGGYFPEYRSPLVDSARPLADGVTSSEDSEVDG
jgi:sugar O-acyltransferase (sialic acid O-acetyltransferase NeuD family)